MGSVLFTRDAEPVGLYDHEGCPDALLNKRAAPDG